MNKENKDDSYNKIIILLFVLIDLGCRVNELLNLEKRFVDFDNNQINFNERKNDQAVAVPMTNRVQKDMKGYFVMKKDFDKFLVLTTLN